MENMNSVLKEAIEIVIPTKKEIRDIQYDLDSYIEGIKKNITKNKLKVEVFIGGSFAKGTVIRKEYYDIDLFLRFDKKYSDKEISKLTGKILKGIKNVRLVHGSRDYYRIALGKNLTLEIVPVTKISKPEEARNVTDMSYSHVRYLKKKLNSKLIQEIGLAKAFTHANKCYGAESYINGFSGYALELLILHYGSFLKFIKEISKDYKEKIIIDIEKKFKNKKEILLNLNSSKLQSPIILIDPTYKNRNALAALTEDTFNSFKKSCLSFLKNPNIKCFKSEKLNFFAEKEISEKKNLEFIKLKFKTDRQEGDIAGTKMKKFFVFLEREISRKFEIKKSGFEYRTGKTAEGFYSVKSKKEIIYSGPGIGDKTNAEMFKKAHKNVYEKNWKLYASEKITENIEEFIDEWKKDNKRTMKEMSVIIE